MIIILLLFCDKVSKHETKVQKNAYFTVNIFCGVRNFLSKENH